MVKVASFQALPYVRKMVKADEGILVPLGEAPNGKSILIKAG